MRDPLARTLFWWHPVVWWASRQLRQLEEECCDGMVLDTLPGVARSYATSLVDTLEFLSQESVPKPMAATGVTAGVALARRITMLKNHRAGSVRLTPGRFVLLLVAAALPMIPN